MRRFLITIALTCVLSGSALAGEMPTCGLQSSGEIPSTGLQSPGHVPSTDSTSPGTIPTCGVSILLTLIDLAF